MLERFSKVFSLAPNLYAKGCPLLIVAGALQKDTETGRILAQLKMKNIGDKDITSCKISLRASENNGHEVEGVKGFSYLDLNVKPGDEFGSKTPVFLPEATARSFSVTVEEIVFADNSVSSITFSEWKPIPQLKPLNTILKDPEIEKQYGIEVGDNYKFVPERYEGLFLCTCGGVNNDTNPRCCKCGRSFETLAEALNAADLREKTNKRLDAERVAREERTKKKEEVKKRTKKIIVITIPAVVVVVTAVLLLTQVIIPSNKYKSAVDLVHEGRYEEAQDIFYNLDDYKDSDEYEKYCSVKSYLAGELEGENLTYLYSDAKSLDGFTKEPNLIEENEYLKQISKIEEKRWNCVKKKNLLYGFYSEDDNRKYSYSAYVNESKEFVLVQNLTYASDPNDSYDNESEFNFIVENGQLTIDLIHTDYVIRDTVELSADQLKVETSETSSRQDDAYMIFQ
ncbi:MAG: hypothetical protein IJJ01_09020 [Firmicutes bacterium]|nr:hypothetical protein [Bacillota bacterium]